MKKIIQKNWLWFLFIIPCVVSILLVFNNDRYYQATIAQVTAVEESTPQEVIDLNQNKDQIISQKITARLTNGDQQGETVVLKNEYAVSKAYDQNYRIGNKLFVTVNQQSNGTSVASIKGVKRDTTLVCLGWLFLFVLVIIGKKKGLLSAISLGLNVVILSVALSQYTDSQGANLFLVMSLTVVFFTVTSLLLVSGCNGKAYAAILTTLAGTFIAVGIAYAVMKLTGERGLRFEEMQFLTRSPREVFLASILVGSLGAVMDIAITMSAAVYELYAKNPAIESKALLKSGMEIGKDVMGTMANVLFFAYVSGAIPMMILYLRNGAAIGYTTAMNLSLELARALAGSIGIVLTIPLGLWISILFIQKGSEKK
ncbi:YibE/F family protein [Isobaculum melis]|uniref:Uncharacterized membrane protein n=1 Tax=Isobaculum melis TaxID=142588 RepID=A0A1H9QDV2_9LACT|nr:YibE/F family protein [Isobaculum melis]SER58598.1 Uncharacterized membrane protein [Isobaculum melis]